MRLRSFGLLCCLLAIPGLRAQSLATTCHATSSYDVSVGADSITFDRAAPAPLRVLMGPHGLRTDGVAVQLNLEGQDRLTLFQRDLRALLPRVRLVADHGVDMAAQAMRAEVGTLGLSADTRTQFDRQLQQDADALKQRIARSQSSHDWQGPAAQQAMQQMASNLVPLVAGDLGQQALNAALSGDLQTAADLRDRAASLATTLQPRLLQRMQALRPQIEALCPAIRQLAGLQQGLRDAGGQPLNLLQIAP